MSDELRPLTAYTEAELRALEIAQDAAVDSARKALHLLIVGCRPCFVERERRKIAAAQKRLEEINHE